MGEDLIRYDLLVQDALRQAVRAVLERAASEGLPGDHHFYIAFATGAPGVRISPRLKAQYPDEMTVVLQHQFWDLRAEPDHFEVKLSFNNVTEQLVVPYTAIRSFADPSVEFGLQFAPPPSPPGERRSAASAPAAPEGAGRASKAPAPDAAKDAGDDDAAPAPAAAEVVQLDAFRKKS